MARHGQGCTKAFTLAEFINYFSPHLASCGEIGGVAKDVHAFPRTREGDCSVISVCENRMLCSEELPFVLFSDCRRKCQAGYVQDSHYLPLKIQC